MDKIYCSNCNAVVTLDMKFCPVCGASLIPTVVVPKPTYTLSDYSIPTKQVETNQLKWDYVALGIFLTGLGFYLIILFPKFAPIAGFPAIIGVGLVLRGIGFVDDKNRRKGVPKKELTIGRVIAYLGMIIFFSSLALGVIVGTLDAKNVGLMLTLLFLIFFVGTSLTTVGGILIMEERQKHASIQISKSL